MENYDYSKIKNIKELNKLVEVFMKNLTNNDYEVKETHQFTMILPETYYGEGSYNKWIRVEWALKNTNEKIFLTWIKLSSQSKSFNFSEIPEYYNMWKAFENRNSDKRTEINNVWAKLNKFIINIKK